MSPAPPILESPFDRLLHARRRVVLGVSLISSGIIGVADWWFGQETSLGVLYILPMLASGIVLNRIEMAGFALLCAILRSSFVEASWPVDFILRFFMGLFAYLCAGLFAGEMVRNRKEAIDHLRQLQEQESLRKTLEEELRLLAESSPAAILTLDGTARILSANAATRILLGIPAGMEVKGLLIGAYLPVLADALKLDAGKGFFRTAAQTQGRRENGDLFVAHTWFSTYESDRGRRLAAIAVDTSDEVREREELNLSSLLENNRIVAGAVSHEIRNICGAASILYSNLKRVPGVNASEDFVALGNLVSVLERIAAYDLRSRTLRDTRAVDIKEVLDQLRIVIEPGWEEIGGVVRWPEASSLPPVHAETQGLMLAFMNLARNSLRAARESTPPEFSIGTQLENGRVLLHFTDSGPGVTNREQLFSPFQPGAEAGMGLYVSRAIVRSFGGDLRYEPVSGLCRFVVELRVYQRSSE